VFEKLGVGDDSKLVLYGEGGGLLAARLYFTLDYLGHGAHTALLDGGLEKWNAESRPTSRQAAHPTPTTFTARVQPELLITTARMQELSRSVASGTSQDYALLDARPPQEFAGAVRSEAVPAAGHIAGAHSLYWKQLIEAKAVPVLRDPSELQREFSKVGPAPGKLIVTYCRTGVQSSFDYFVAKYLGYKAAMYDGSVYEWVHAGGNPLVASDSNLAPGKHQPVNAGDGFTKVRMRR
jgi:thiosulfate/3-mercaptopyruvate sulfurtransferase